MATRYMTALELFVYRIPWTVSHRELKKYFQQFGDLEKVFLSYDMKTGFHKGQGTVRFKSHDGLEKALQTENHVVDGEKIQIKRNEKLPEGFRITSYNEFGWN